MPRYAFCRYAAFADVTPAYAIFHSYAVSLYTLILLFRCHAMIFATIFRHGHIFRYAPFRRRLMRAAAFFR